MTELKHFKLPDVGEGLTEADIVKWHVQPGDRVAVNEIIVEIETAKAVVELPSPYEGVVAGLLVAEGQTVDVGTPIIAVDVSSGTPGDGPEESTPASDAREQNASERGGEQSRGASDTENAETAERLTAALPTAGSEVRLPAPSPVDLVPPLPIASEGQGHGGGTPEEPVHGGEARQPVLVGYGVKLGATKRRPRRRSTAAASAPADRSIGRTAGTSVVALAKPPVRKLAKELGVDLTALAGSGPSGSITRDDVQQAAQALGERGAVLIGRASAAPDGATSGVSQARSGPREERIPIRGVRKHTAAAVTASAFTAPHVTEFLQVDVTETVAAVDRVRRLPEFADVRVSPLLFVVRALLSAVARHPMINSSWDERAGEIVVKRYVNLGIAAATERGLVVPNIKDAHALPLPALAQALVDLATTARAGKTTPADMRGGTITISNVGVFGVDTGTPILTPGEAAILAFGQIRDMPWVHDGRLAVRKVTTLALSFDHRIVDGDLGSAVLRDVGAMLEDPVRMIAWQC